ncbi:unnamed protein product, partial [Ranitomeya imitator]
MPISVIKGILKWTLNSAIERISNRVLQPRSQTQDPSGQKSPRLAGHIPWSRNSRTNPSCAIKDAKILENYLVRADVGSSNKEIKTKSFCPLLAMGLSPCSNISKSDSFTQPRSGRRYSIKGHFTCNSSYEIYLIKCPCGLGYVGETTQHTRDRISQHKSTIRCGRTLLSIPAYFLHNNHSIALLKYQ